MSKTMKKVGSTVLLLALSVGSCGQHCPRDDEDGQSRSSLAVEYEQSDETGRTVGLLIQPDDSGRLLRLEALDGDQLLHVSAPLPEADAPFSTAVRVPVPSDAVLTYRLRIGETAFSELAAAK